jgi:hypothetical protein
LQRADRRRHHRDAQVLAEYPGCQVDLDGVAQHARPEGDTVQRLAVAPHGRLALGAADEVVPEILVEVDPRRLDDLVQGLKTLFDATRHEYPRPSPIMSLGL